MLVFVLCGFFLVAQVADVVMSRKNALGLLLQHAAHINRQQLFQGLLIGVFGAVLALLHAVQHRLISQAKIGLGFKPQTVQGSGNAAGGVRFVAQIFGRLLQVFDKARALQTLFLKIRIQLGIGDNSSGVSVSGFAVFADLDQLVQNVKSVAVFNHVCVSSRWVIKE